MRVILPQPPNPDDPAYKSNQSALARAQYWWMSRLRAAIEDSSRLNNRPMGQKFVVGTFTTNTTISGTSTGTDVANFMSSLVKAMEAKGLVSQTVSRTGG
jgi:phosphotransferase system IIB component